MGSSRFCPVLSRLLIFGSAILQFACGSSGEATIYLVDGTQNTGPLLFVSDSSVDLSPISLPVPEMGKGVYRVEPRTFPNDRISRVTVSTERSDSDASLIRTGMTLAGVVVGAVAGGVLGAQFPSGDSWSDIVAVPVGIIGGVVGGFAGAAIGRSMTNDTFESDPKIESQRDSLRLCVPGE